MSFVQYVGLNGQLIGKPIEASSYVRIPVVGDLVWARADVGAASLRMQVAGVEHRAIRQGGQSAPLIVLFVAPYEDGGTAMPVFRDG